MGNIASAILLVLALVAYNNYKAGTLKPWLQAKFFNSAAPKPADISGSWQQTSATGGDTTASLVSTGASSSGLGALLTPVAGVVTGLFGEKRATHNHAGIDYGVKQGTTVQAARAGTVSYAGNASGYGLLVKVDHGKGAETLYGHLSRIDVRLGQKVVAGQSLGLSGNTGDSTGPHLHFELRESGKAVDPNPYLATPSSVGAALTA